MGPTGTPIQEQPEQEQQPENESEQEQQPENEPEQEQQPENEPEQEQQPKNEPELEQQLVHPQQDVKMKGEMPSDFPGISEVQLVEIKTEMPSYSASEPSSSAAQKQGNLPSGDLLGNRQDYLNIGVPLYEASVKGDWETAKDIFGTNPELVRYSVTENFDTALHIAASAKSTKLVENFVKQLMLLMRPEDLLIQNRSANTAFCLAAAAGNVSIAKIMVEKKPELVNISGTQGMMPLYIASLYGKYEMVNYLYGVSDIMGGKYWNQTNRGWVLHKCMEADFFDVALKMVKDNPELSLNHDVLRILARKTDSFEAKEADLISRVIKKISLYFKVSANSYLFRLVSVYAAIVLKIWHGEEETQAMELLKIVWSNIVQCDKPQVDDIIRGPPDTPSQSVAGSKHSSHVLFIAAETGNTKLLVELIRKYPDLIWTVNDKNQSVFHAAVLYRQEGIYNLLYEIGSMKDLVTPLIDKEGNNMLHLAGMMAKNRRLQGISGVALQMQRQMIWYKEVERMLPPSYREKKNNKGQLPHELFTEEHKDLLSASEKWMKDTASQSMVVAALIATIVFAVAFTVPGGYDQTKGFPLLLHKKKAFIVFVISDAISLALATTSILMFLYILTSRYAEQDFLESLPKKLMRGLLALFLSITAMMVAFSASFFVLYEDKLIWVPIVVSVFSSMPVILYARLQCHLLVDVYLSTYGSKKLFKPKKPILYGSNRESLSSIISRFYGLFHSKISFKWRSHVEGREGTNPEHVQGRREGTSPEHVQGSEGTSLELGQVIEGASLEHGQGSEGTSLEHGLQ